MCVLRPEAHLGIYFYSTKKSSLLELNTCWLVHHACKSTTTHRNHPHIPPQIQVGIRNNAAHVPTSLSSSHASRQHPSTSTVGPDPAGFSASCYFDMDAVLMTALDVARGVSHLHRNNILHAGEEMHIWLTVPLVHNHPLMHLYIPSRLIVARQKLRNCLNTHMDCNVFKCIYYIMLYMH